MSSGGGGGGGLHPEIGKILLVLFVLFLAWFIFGGRDRAKNVSEPFLHPAAPIDSGEEFGPTGKGEQKPFVHSW